MAHFFVKRLLGPKSHIRIGREVLRLLRDYAWPANVRELEGAMQYAVGMCRGGEEIQARHLPDKIDVRCHGRRGRGATPHKETPRREQKPEICGLGHPAGTNREGSKTLRESMSAHECLLLRREYAALKGNVSEMARRLDVSRGYLYGRLREFGLHGKGEALNADG